MALPLRGLAISNILVPPIVGRTDGPATKNVIIGVRGDRLGSAASGRPSAVIERQIEHLRQTRSSLRAYTYLHARLALSNDRSFQDDPETAQIEAAKVEESPERDGQFRQSDSLIAPGRLAALGVPINLSEVKRTNIIAAPRQTVVIQNGDTIEDILIAAGMGRADASMISTLLRDRPSVSGRQFLAGDLVEFIGGGPTGAGTLSHPILVSFKPDKIIFKRKEAVISELALTDTGHYAAVNQMPQQTAPSTSEDSLNDFSLNDADTPTSFRESISALVDQGRLTRPLADDITRICSSAVDLGRPVTLGDTISILFSPVTSDGRSQPEVAYVSITSDGHQYSFYRWAADPAAAASYFDESGRSEDRFLLRKPVAAGRLGDGFGWRIHPVLGDRRFHEGVDYAAPFGSPIVAAGAGVVEKIDEQWGYGKYIRISHDQGYETTYAHISGTPRTIKVGTRVSQGDTIAYVGSTGLSTGPHLYYEVRVNGRDVDPLRIRLAAGAVLHGSELSAFEIRRKRVDLLVKDAADGAGLEFASLSR